MMNDGRRVKLFFFDRFCVWHIWLWVLYMRGCIFLLSLTPLQLYSLHSAGNFSSKSHVLLLFFKFAGMGICSWSYCCWCHNWSIRLAAAFSILYAQVHILPAAAATSNYWESRRRDVRCNLNVVCRAFRVGHFAGGLFRCLVCVNCTDTRVSIPSFGGFSLLLSALAGVH